MRREKIDVAQDIAGQLFAFERAIDAAITAGTRLAGTMPSARLDARLAAAVGQGALERVMGAVMKIALARGELVDGHALLDHTRRELGLPEAFGDGVKIGAAPMVVELTSQTTHGA